MPPALIQGFLKDSVLSCTSGYGTEAEQRRRLQADHPQEGDSWDVEGIVQGEDFQNYSPHDAESGDSISYNCNCHEAFMGVAVTWPPP